MSTALGQSSHYGTALTSLIVMDVVTVMMWECTASQVTIGVVVTEHKISIVIIRIACFKDVPIRGT